MDDPDLRALARRIAQGQDGVHHFPIRHHSPACARHLAAALAELRPAVVLLEMPVDFAPLLPLLLDAGTRPPVAIVSTPPAGSRSRPTSYWPVSATSPELAAIRAAQALGARLVPCDLPSTHPVMLGHADDDAQHGAPRPLGDERQLAHSAWMQALVRRTGSRDFNEVWDRLFESRIAGTDWRDFFASVAVYCASSRASTPDGELSRDTLPREAQMRAALAACVGQGRVAVVTGGFHTPALLSWDDADAVTPAGAGTAHLVRFSQPRLDRLNGYGAGMPSPAWYERLFDATQSPDAEPFAACAQDALLGLAERLRRDRPALAPNVPALVAALQHAQRLADLRGLPGPGRTEVLDAARACFLQDEDPRFGAPILAELHADLTGWAIGDVPPGAGSPPLVEAARAAARRLGFTLADSIRRTRELDIHRTTRHRDASRFLHALEMLGVPFARMESGPDWAVGANPGTLFEVWSYAWSPMVEAALIDAAGDGDSVERACVSRLRRQFGAGPGRDAVAVCRMVTAAARAGLQSLLGELLPAAVAAIADDPDLVRVATALGELCLVWRARAVLGLTGNPDVAAAVAGCFRRACYLAAEVADSAPERARDLVGALVAIRDVLDTTEAGTLDRDLFDEAVDRLAAQAEAMPPVLSGAVMALAVQAGRRPPEWLATEIAGALAGPKQAEHRVGPLHGLMLVAPELLRRLGALAARLDDLLGRLPEESFVALLPHLRRAFSTLDPRETAALAADVAARHGLGPLALHTVMPQSASEAELLANLAHAQELARLLERDGLAHWLAP
jgi:hypothetical protein